MLGGPVVPGHRRPLSFQLQALPPAGSTSWETELRVSGFGWPSVQPAIFLPIKVPARLPDSLTCRPAGLTACAPAFRPARPPALPPPCHPLECSEAPAGCAQAILSLSPPRLPLHPCCRPACSCPAARRRACGAAPTTCPRCSCWRHPPTPSPQQSSTSCGRRCRTARRHAAGLRRPASRPHLAGALGKGISLPALRMPLSTHTHTHTHTCTHVHRHTHTDVHTPLLPVQLAAAASEPGPAGLQHVMASMQGTSMLCVLRATGEP